VPGGGAPSTWCWPSRSATTEHGRQAARSVVVRPGRPGDVPSGMGRAPPQAALIP
jgi:hypothetical protein